MRAALFAALIAAPAAADVMHEPGGWALCSPWGEDFLAGLPSIVGGVVPPAPPTWAARHEREGPTVVRGETPEVAPAPLGGIAPLLAGLLAGLGLARRLLR